MTLLLAASLTACYFGLPDPTSRWESRFLWRKLNKALHPLGCNGKGLTESPLPLPAPHQSVLALVCRDWAAVHSGRLIPLPCTELGCRPRHPPPSFPADLAWRPHHVRGPGARDAEWQGQQVKNVWMGTLAFYTQRPRRRERDWTPRTENVYALIKAKRKKSASISITALCVLYCMLGIDRRINQKFIYIYSTSFKCGICFFGNDPGIQSKSMM